MNGPSSILYRENDYDWNNEKEYAEKYFRTIKSRLFVKENEIVIPRYCALPFYKELETEVNYQNAKLINTYQQHRYIADLGNWYYDLHQYTPITWKTLHEIPEEGPFILKGETNSKKYNWNTQMFADNKKEAIQVHSLLTNDSMLQYQNIYIRKYIELEKLADGLQGLPITKEFRFFVYKTTILSGGFYWSSHVDDLDPKDTDPAQVPVEFLNKVINIIQNTEISNPPNFYVIDVAKTNSGEWIVIELNDGSMSGLSENNPEKLYSNLRKAI